MDGCCKRAWPAVEGTIPRQMGVGYIRKVSEQARESKRHSFTVSTSECLLYSRMPILLYGFYCLEYPPCLASLRDRAECSLQKK